MSASERLHSRGFTYGVPAPPHSQYSNSAPPPELCEGDVVAHKYYVDRVVGRDGLAIVAHVRHVELGRPYSFKYLPPEHCVYPELVARFLRGARAAQGLQSEHSARVVDAGRLESGAPYAVSEFLAGAPLREVLSVRGAFSITDAIDFILQACEAIAEAHACRLVHKNLSLSKLFVTQRPDGVSFVKVADFGIADAVRSDPLGVEGMRDAGPSYANDRYADSLACVAPEQVRNHRDLDVRADIWALGCILHELLTGAPVFHAESAPALLAMIVADPPVPLRALRTDVPAALEAVVLHCLEKDPGARYPTLGEFALALKPFALPEARNTADRIVRTLGRSYRQPNLQRALVHVGPAAAGPQMRQPVSTPPALPQLPPPPPRQEPSPSKALPLGLGLGGLVLGAFVALLAVKFSLPSAKAPPDHDASAAQLSLQREIVREIAALRAQREESESRNDAALEASSPKTERAPKVRRERPAKRREGSNKEDQTASTPATESAPRAETESTEDPSARRLSSAAADEGLFDKVH